MTNESTPIKETFSSSDPKMQERLMSIDVLRGFDMFWICGGKAFFLFFIVLFCGKAPGWTHSQLSHIPWEGFNAYDLIMPLFLFIVGVAMPFSLFKRLQRDGMWKIYVKIFRRFLILWVLGMVAQGNLLDFNLEKLRLFSNTLQAIAVGYLFSSILMIHFRLRWQVVLTGVLLLVYWGLMTFAPIPGVEGVGHLEPDLNFALYVDKVVLGPFNSGKSYTWVLSSMTFITSVMLGVFGGELLRSNRSRYQKVCDLFGLGLLCLFLGWLWSYEFPIIKHLWTSSMVLWAAGWCYLLLASFYLVIDVWNWRAWSFPFVVIGSNAIFAYMIGRPLNVYPAVNSLFHGITPHLPEAIAGYFINMITFVLLWGVLYFLYRKRTFIRI